MFSFTERVKVIIVLLAKYLLWFKLFTFQLFWQLVDDSKADIQGLSRHFIIGGSSISLSVRREQLYSDAFSELASPDVGGCGCAYLYEQKSYNFNRNHFTLKN